MNVIIASDVLDSARRVYLNDPNAQTYTDAKLLPHLKEAVGFLETTLEENDIQCKNSISAPYTILAGVTELISLPPDFVWPIRIEERLKGTTDLYVPLLMRAWEPQAAKTDRLQFWVWRLDRILFLGATTDREIILYYQASFPPINTVDDRTYNYARPYLVAKVAAFAHEFLAQNESLAKQCNDVAEANLAQVVNINTKKKQALVYRRKPYHPYK